MSDSAPETVIDPYTGIAMPYALTSEEHILPVAIAGFHDFTIRVETKVNSDIGKKVDGPVVNHPAFRFLAHDRGVKGRNGVPSFGREIGVTFEGCTMPVLAVKHPGQNEAEI